MRTADFHHGKNWVPGAIFSQVEKSLHNKIAFIYCKAGL